MIGDDENASETRGDRPHGGHDPRNSTVSSASRRQSASAAETTRDEAQNCAPENDIDPAKAHRIGPARPETGKETTRKGKRRNETANGQSESRKTQALKAYHSPGYIIPEDA